MYNTEWRSKYLLEENDDWSKGWNNAVRMFAGKTPEAWLIVYPNDTSSYVSNKYYQEIKDTLGIAYPLYSL